MSKVINITDRFNTDIPTTIKIGEKEYPVSNTMETVFKFEELATNGSNKGMLEAMTMALGKEAAEELKLSSIAVSKFKILTIAVMAAMQDLTYEDAEARFQRQV